MNRLASFSIAFAGALHIALAPEHYAHSPAHGIFFAIAGAAEIVWALAFLRWPGERMYYIGIVLAGALIVTWAATRIIPAPFEHEIGVVDLQGVVTKLSELIGLLALVALATKGRVTGLAKRTFAGFLAEAVVLAGFFGFGFYMVAHSVEPYMPFLGGEAHEEQDGQPELLP